MHKSFLIFFIAVWYFFSGIRAVSARERFFEVQAIDTMKYSRDLAREKIDKSDFDAEIDFQIKNITQTGATHVAVATPYDVEFLPFLRRWVASARKNNLKIWFRGNFSGWENWFDYQKINKDEHTAKIKDFILKNKELFEDGDVFTSCPECENGGPGDPRITRDIEGFRGFLIGEYQAAMQAFKTIGKKVIVNYFSMNGDVASLIMDAETTKALGGVVTIDHYVKTADKLAADIKDFAKRSEGKVVLGEFGAPIPDIHGNMSEHEQAAWVEEVLLKVIKDRKVIGINYWTSKGGSSKLWNADNSPRQAVEIITKYYKPANLSGAIKDDSGSGLTGVKIKSFSREYTAAEGNYLLPVIDEETVSFSKEGYKSVEIKTAKTGGGDIQKDIILIKTEKSFLEKIIQVILSFVRSWL